MSDFVEIEQQIQSLFASPPYGGDPMERKARLLALFKDELNYAGERNPGYRNLLENWPVDFRSAESIADLPFLPVSIFKSDPPPSLISPQEIKRTLYSSATTGQTPSRVVLDSATARRMSKGIVAIMRDFLGPARRPYLVIDTQDSSPTDADLGARGAAIQGLTSFATETVYCLNGGDKEPVLDLGKLVECSKKWGHSEVLVYGFTYVIWKYFIQPLQSKGIQLDMPNVRVLHSGGWKRLEAEAVTKDAFSNQVAAVFGCPAAGVIDFYGMVENVGVIYPDCQCGNKHVPLFADVLVRDPLTLRPVQAGEQGLVQVCSVLPTSFPGFLLLTEDIGEIVDYHECPCGRRGTCFRFVKRAPKAEVRGCGNIESSRRSVTQNTQIR
jgi:phenylacetate-coenzyme A ligase PaaK-like adenylate-forming protein